MTKGLNRTYSLRIWSWLVCGYGLLCRIYTYLANKAIWHDEASIFFALAKTPLSQLHLPLEGSPGGSLVFTLLQKVMFEWFGYSDYAGRFFPFLFSCAALVLFAITVTRFCSPLVGFLAIGLFAISDNLIFYASEVRPYAMDVFFACVIIFFYFHIMSEPKNIKKSLFYLGFAGFISIFSSFPVLFCLASLGLILSVQFITRKNHKLLVINTCIITIWLGLFSFYFLWSLRHWSTGINMVYYGNVFQFLHFPINSLKELLENLIQFFRIIAFYIGLSLNILHLYPSDFIKAMTSIHSFWAFIKPHILYLTYILILTISTGLLFLKSCFSVWRQNRMLALFLFGPIILVSTASSLLYYPFLGRHLLFIIPFITLIFSFGIARLYHTHKHVFFIFVLILFIHPSLESIYHLYSPRSLNGLTQALSIVLKQDIKTVYISTSFQNWNLFYESRYDLSSFSVVTLKSFDETYLIPKNTNNFIVILSEKPQHHAHFLSHFSLNYKITKKHTRDHLTTIYFLIKKTHH